MSPHSLVLTCLLSSSILTSSVLADPVISEFMATNETTIKDGHDNYEDWIEIWNPDPAAVDLAGWRLTDNSANLGKFIFPTLTIPAGGRVIVFASNRAGSTGATTHVDPLGYRHTNFSLSKGGEYLALVKPDGVTKTTVFNPFPQQIDDISFGLPAANESLINATTPIRIKVPTTSADDTAVPNWTQANFIDTGWTAATGSGIGFEVGPPRAAWLLDESVGATTAADFTGLGATANLNGTGQVFGVTGANAGTSKAVQLSGAGGLTVPYRNELNPAATFTFAAWVYPTVITGGHQAVVSSRVGPAGQQRGYILYAAPFNGALRWEFWTGTVGTWHVVAGPNLVANTWTHVAISRDAAGTKRLYINGAQIASEVGGYVMNNNTANGFHLGCGDDLGTGFRFVGRIDDAGFWSTDVGASIIGQHMATGVDTFPSPLYPFHFQNNVQSSMFGTNSGIYTRHLFTVPDKTRYSGLRLRVKYDDGFVASLNGTEILRRNFTSTRAFNSVAATDRTENDAIIYEDVDISSAALPLLNNGANTLAIHGMTYVTSAGDFLLTPLLDAGVAPAAQNPGYYAVSTPGAANSSNLVNPGPEISSVTHAPLQLPVATALSVTAHVKPRLGPIGAVSLKYRVQYGAESAAIPMTDAGPVPLATDGSRIYTGTIPASHGATARQMLRYVIFATDTTNRSWQSPYPVDLNNDDGVSQSPQYYGTVIVDPALTASMPIMQWFTADVANSDSRIGSRASVFYAGKFYDNIYVRQRGGYTSSGSQKFNFNAKDGIYVNPTLGTVGELNMNSSGLDPNQFRVSTAYSIYRAAGHPALESFPVAMVRNGSAHRMAQLIEQLDEDFLKRKGFDNDGALYKFVQRLGEEGTAGNVVGGDYSGSPGFKFENPIYGVEKKTRTYEGFADFTAFCAGIAPTGTLADRKTFLFKNMNLPNLVNFMAIRSLISEQDVNRKNFYAFRDTIDSEEWFLFPWDKDMTMGVGYNTTDSTFRNNPWQATNTFKHDPAGTKQWCVLWQTAYDMPEVRAMVGRRLRTLMETMMGAPGTAIPGTTPLEQRLEEIRAMLVTPPPGFSVDGNYRNRSSFDTWLGQHRTALYTTYGPTSAYGMIPTTASPAPVVSISNASANPATATAGFSPQDHEYLDITNSNAEDVDISGWTVWKSDGITPFMTFASGTVIPGTARAPLNKLAVARDVAGFRQRPGAPAGPEFVVGSYSSQLSARGETLQLRDAALATSRLVSTYITPVAPTAPQQQLRITEVNYAPLPGDYVAGDYEFLELRNIGTTPLDLTGCNFTDGVNYTFGNVILQAGARLILAKNLTAFTSRYGTQMTVLGPFEGALNNAGDRIRIEDSVGEEILDFTYSPTWQPSTDQVGNSLVIRDESANFATWTQASAWTQSPDLHGSPGWADPAIPTLAQPGALTMEPTSGGDHKINFKAIPGRPYLLEFSDDLGNWQPLITLTPDVNGTAECIEPQAVARKFYRVRSP